MTTSIDPTLVERAKKLDDILLMSDHPEKPMKLLLAATYDVIDPMDLIVWCNVNAIYGIPTLELVVWLKRLINNRSVLEIGAGRGDLGFHLNCDSTDSYIQQEKPMGDINPLLPKNVIAMPTKPMKRVQKMEALTAVATFKPKVVVASWVTQKIYQDKEPEDVTDMIGNADGVEEHLILDKVETYVLIGNENVHAAKRIMKRPHMSYAFPWLRSRASEPDLNRVWVWENKK